MCRSLTAASTRRAPKAGLASRICGAAGVSRAAVRKAYDVVGERRGEALRLENLINLGSVDPLWSAFGLVGNIRMDSSGV